MKEGERKPVSGRSLLYLQAVFAFITGALNVPLDMLGDWLSNRAFPDTVPYTKFKIVSALVFSVISFCAWRWMLPRLRGVLMLRLMVQVMLGIVLFSYGLVAAFHLWSHLPGVSSDAINQLAAVPASANLIIVCGATLCLILGGLALHSASQEQHQLRELALSAQLEALRSQLNHHFLFNSLNVIAEAAAVQPQRAERLILQLASVLRYSLGKTRLRMAPLIEELAAVTSYLELERARSGDRISVRIESEPDVREIHVPPLLIQPLVENAVAHGLMNGTCAGAISIAAWRNDDQLCIRVEDNGVGFHPERPVRNGPGGVGLANLRRRLRAFYGDHAAFQLRSSTGEGTVAQISIPLTDRNDSSTPRHGFVWDGFFSFLGSITPVLAFALSLWVLRLGVAWSLLIGQAMELAYLFAASAAEETKTFDVAMVLFVFMAQVAYLASFDAFFAHTAVWLYASCAAVALLPQLFGAEPFTCYWMRRSHPVWMQKTATFTRVCRHLSAAWGLAFVTLAVACSRQADADSLILLVPLVVATALFGPLGKAYLSLFIGWIGLETEDAETFILGLPFRFQRSYAPAYKLSVQFVVSGGEPGSYYVEIRDGRCVSGQGNLREPDVTIYCGTDSWSLVSKGEMSPADAVKENRLRFRGSPDAFAAFFRCFRLPAGNDSESDATSDSSSPAAMRA